MNVRACVVVKNSEVTGLWGWLRGLVAARVEEVDDEDDMNGCDDEDDDDEDDDEGCC